jgi:hypothetical protein
MTANSEGPTYGDCVLEERPPGNFDIYYGDGSHERGLTDYQEALDILMATEPPAIWYSSYGDVHRIYP